MPDPFPLAFVVAPTDQGTFIVNRFDRRDLPGTISIGVGHQLLSSGSYDQSMVTLINFLLDRRRRYQGDGMVMVDCGANIGVIAVTAAKAMRGWGSVIAIEPQERIYYALAGNVALSNCPNLHAMQAVVGAEVGTMKIPRPNYFSGGSFGSLELRHSPTNEFIGQNVSYAEQDMASVVSVTLDSMGQERLDLLKIDVEGMEIDVLRGARDTIQRCRPILVIEFGKVGIDVLAAALVEHDYTYSLLGNDIVAFHADDPTSKHLKVAPQARGQIQVIMDPG